VEGVEVAGAFLRAGMTVNAERVPEGERALDVDDCMARMLDGDADHRYSVAWIDCMARGGSLGRSVLTRGDHATRDELPAAHRDRARERRLGPTIPAPPWFPGGLLNPLSIGAFNELWFRKAPTMERDAIHSIDSFFFPLDKNRHSNAKSLRQ
jgi:decaprenylphospho-beta-D-ribofuranose 2-oxidase